MDDKDWFGPYVEPVTCPECREASAWAEWASAEVGCEDCGSHAAVECPRCRELFDHVWGVRLLDDSNTEIVEAVTPA